MRKTFWQSIKIAVLSCVLLLPSFALSAEEKDKIGGTLSIMLRVHYEEMLELRSLRHQVNAILGKNRFKGTQPFGYIYLRDIKHGGVSFTAFMPEQHEAIRNVLKKNLKNVIVDQMGDEFTLRYTEEVEKQNADRIMPETMEILYRRLVGFGVANPKITRVGKSHVLVEVPNRKEQDTEDFKQLITRTARLSFLLENDEMSPQEALVRSPGVGSAIFYRHQAGQFIPYLLDVQPVITDRNIAKVVTGNDGREPFVLAVLHPNAAKRLEQVTANNVGRRMAIMFEDMVYMAPTIMETIRSGQIKITNHFSGPEAAGFAVLLASGSYPVSVEVVDERIEQVEQDDATCCEDKNEYFEPTKQELRDEPMEEFIDEVIEKEEMKPQPHKPEPVAEPAKEEPVVEEEPESQQDEPSEMESLMQQLEDSKEETKGGVEEPKPEPVQEVKEPVKSLQVPEGGLMEYLLKNAKPVEEPVENEPVVQEESVEKDGPTLEEIPVEPEFVEPEVEPEPVVEAPAKVQIEETVIQKEDVVTAPSEMKSSSDALFDEQVIKVEPLAKVVEPMVTEEEMAKPREEEIAPELMDHILADEDVQMELSRFEQYLHGTDKLDFHIEDVTSTPRQVSQPKTLKQLRVGDGL